MLSKEMSSLAFNIQPKLLPILTKGVPLFFPTRRVYCCGFNYDSHNREMGRVGHILPSFFCKPSDCVVVDENNFSDSTSTVSIRYPSLTESYHHEVELVVALGPSADGNNRYFNLRPEQVSNIIYGYGVGLDMTRRDLQMQAKENGTSWDMAKGADDSAVVSAIIPVKHLQKNCPDQFVDNHKGEVGNDEGQDVNKTSNNSAGTNTCDAPGTSTEPSAILRRGKIELSVNGTVRQNSDLSCMINPVHDIIVYLSKYVTLQPGDLIYTGTPSGVGPVRRGDKIEAGIEGIGRLNVTII